MRICPKCQITYIDTIRTCSDCQCNLIPLEDFNHDSKIPIYHDTSREYMEQLVEYLNYSNITDVEILSDNGNSISNDTGNIAENFPENSPENSPVNSFTLMIQKKDEVQVRKLLNLYFEKELKEDDKNVKTAAPSDREFPEDTTASVVEDNDEHIAPFVDSQTKYNDLKDSAIVLLLFGILGDAYIIGKYFKIIPFGPDLDGVYGIMFVIVMGILFNVFLVGGIVSLRSSKKIQGQIAVEQDLTQRILEQYTSIPAQEYDKNYSCSSDIGDLYYARTNYIKSLIEKDYGKLDASYLEEMIEQIYSSVFES